MAEVRPIAFVPGYDTDCMSGGGLNFGVECELRLRQFGGGPLGTGWQRIIDLDSSGAGCSTADSGMGDLQENVEDGSSEACSYGGIVYREGGPATIGGIEARLDAVQAGLDGTLGAGLLDDHDCDGFDPGQVDDFDEVFASPDGGPPVPGEVVVLTCADVDRLVYLPVIAALPPSASTGVAIDGFIPFFITGCIVYEPGPDFDDECDEDPDNPFGPAPLEPFSVTGIPVKLQEPLENGVGVKGLDNYGTYRNFLYED
jgi:hypothetical protein